MFPLYGTMTQAAYHGTGPLSSLQVLKSAAGRRGYGENLGSSFAELRKNQFFS
jgi:hypothetical protein